jgi:sugar-phosphatase
MMWPPSKACQSRAGLVVAIAGVAGSGKSTLGRALARALGAPLLDLDALTNPLLDHLPAEFLGERLPAGFLGDHWLASPHRAAIRDGRYAALRAVTRDIVDTAGQAVLVAPFTAELRGGEPWHLLRRAAGASGLRMVHIDGDAELFAARRAARSAERDQHRIGEPPAPPPAVPVITVAGDLAPARQLRLVLAALDLDPAPRAS